MVASIYVLLYAVSFIKNLVRTTIFLHYFFGFKELQTLRVK